MRDAYPVGLIFVGALGVAAAYAATFGGLDTLGPWLLAAGATLVLAGLGVLGAGPRSPRLAAAVLLACALTFVGFATGLLLGTPAPDGPLLLGLPRATTLLLLASGLVPLVLLPLAYGLLFPREVMPRGNEPAAEKARQDA